MEETNEERNARIDEYFRQREIKATADAVAAFLQKTEEHVIFPAYRNSLWPEWVIKSRPKGANAARW